MKEIISANPYFVQERKDSALVPGLVIEKIIGVKCPRCGHLLDIKHGEKTHCECGLWVQLWGASLHISGTETDE